MRDAPAHVEAIAAAAEIDVVGRRRARMLHEPFEQADALVLLRHERLAEQVAERQRA